MCSNIELTGVNWLVMPSAPGASLPVEVKHRYNEPAVSARISALPDGRVRVSLHAPQAGVAPGQACVCYAGSRLVAGGWIERAPPLWREEAGARLSA